MIYRGPLFNIKTTNNFKKNHFKIQRSIERNVNIYKIKTNKYLTIEKKILRGISSEDIKFNYDAKFAAYLVDLSFAPCYK